MHPQLQRRVAAYRQDDLVAAAARARRGAATAGRGRRRPAARGLRRAIGTRLIEIGWRLVQDPRPGG
ncbi:MAG TPA: hypothetical protein VKY26_02125 [Actinomycetota bacterium]|nr:hypothetical protein [Actinomycetota bacterium]